MNKELTLEEAENIVDNMYQNRWKECGVEEGNTIHLGNLSNLKYNELESASILLLRTEISLKREIKKLQQENQKQKEVIDNATKAINEMIHTGYILKNDNSATEFMATGKNSEFGVRAEALLEILKGELNNDI